MAVFIIFSIIEILLEASRVHFMCIFFSFPFYLLFLSFISFSFHAAIIVKPFAHALCIWSSDIQRHSHTHTHANTYTCNAEHVTQWGGQRFGSLRSIRSYLSAVHVMLHCVFFLLPFSETDFPPIMCAREREA